MEGSFARARPEIVRCFDEALQQRAHTTGLLAFRVKIAADGTARELCLGASGNVEERGLQACVGNVLAQTKYPLIVEGKMTVHGLYAFSPPLVPPPRGRGPGWH